jgi:hypothetical protein
MQGPQVALSRRRSFCVASFACLTLLGVLWLAPPSFAVSDRIVFLKNLVIWSADANGANQQQITESGVEYHAVDLSPDGRTAVAATNVSMVIVDLTTHVSKVIYSGSVGQPKFFPSGTKIIFQTGGGDIATMNTDGTGFTNIITWKGIQRLPDVSPDGTKIAFESVTDPKGRNLTGGEQIFIANADGTNPLQVTKDSGGIVGGSDDPVFSPSGTSLAFGGSTGPFQADYRIFTISTSGTNQTQLTTNTGNVPDWSPDGSKIMFATTRNKGTNNHDLYTVNASGGNEQALITDPIYDLPQGMYRHPSLGTWLGSRFMPILDFSSQEKWRPLNVEAFLKEVEPSTGQPWNQICNEGVCTGLQGETSLITAPYASDYMKLHNSGGEPNSYRSPYPSCIHTVGGTEVFDCDSGPESSIYYHIVGPSPAGYQYIDYGIFYRYNQGYLDIGNHAGDWEGVTVAPAANYATFHFAEFSIHGKWDSFLRENLECDNGGEGSCGSELGEHYTGLHVISFPASGSHANYTRPNSGPSTDGNTDGKAPWGSNLNPEALILFPTTAAQGAAWTSGPEHWTDWPGRWGETEPGELELPGESQSPCSPAARCSKDHANHFFAPWTGVTCETGGACPARTKQPQPFSCSDWFGYSVAALACEPRAMRHALRDRGLGDHGRFTIRLIDQKRKSATAPGLAQVIGRAMSPGEDAEVTGTVPTGTTILVRLQTAHGLLSAVFDKFGGFRGRALIVVRRRGRALVAYIMRGRHRQTATSFVRESLGPRG